MTFTRDHMILMYTIFDFYWHDVKALMTKSLVELQTEAQYIDFNILRLIPVYQISDAILIWM